MQVVTVDRHKYIGGSDIPIIMGLSKFKTRFDLLLEKAELKENDFEGNKYTEYGNVMEEKIRNYINETLYPKNPFKENKIINGVYRYHSDGVNSIAVLEVKTTSQTHEKVEEYITYLVQLLKGMIENKKDKGTLVVYERPKDFNEEFDPKRLQIFMIDIDNFKDLIVQINNACEQFIIDWERLKENPLLTEEDLLPVDLTKQANEVLKLELQLSEFKKIEAKYNEEKEKLRQSMIKAPCKKWTTPNGTQITLIEDKDDEEVEVEYYDEDKFIAENTELYNSYHTQLFKYAKKKKEIKKGRKGSLRITLPKGE